MLNTRHFMGGGTEVGREGSIGTFLGFGDHNRPKPPHSPPETRHFGGLFRGVFRICISAGGFTPSAHNGDFLGFFPYFRRP